ncbi:MAG: FlgD immunoglobulin-like domain containing protein [Candidatus Krumholzibacteriia bacterium]
MRVRSSLAPKAIVTLLAAAAVAILGVAAAAGEPATSTRIGRAPAKFRLPTGGLGMVPGPYQDLDGQPYVAALRRRFYECRETAQGKASSQLPFMHPSNGLLNVPVNDRTGEPLGRTQTEPAIAVSGDTLVCGFTDSEAFFSPGETHSAYAYSFDRGLTWIDGGSLPLRGNVGPSELLLGDPVVCTDGAGRWYYVSVYDIGNGLLGPGSGDYGLALSRGSFVGGVLQWSVPMLIAGSDLGSSLEHHHAVLDATNDRLYVTYTNTSLSLNGWGQIEVVTLEDHGTEVHSTVIVQPEVVQTNNAGSRVAIGPNGEVYCAFESGVLGGLGQGPAVQKVARSTTRGESFETPVVAATVIESWFSNPPGSNRLDHSVEFPDIAVDTSPGANRGRVYLTWHDAVEMDFTGVLDAIPEITGDNGSVQTAQVLPDTSQHWLIEGSLPMSDDFDFYRFSGSAGEHLRVFFDPSGFLHPHIKLWCFSAAGGSADTLLAQSSRGIGAQAFLLITLPYTGDYVLEFERSMFSGSYVAWVRRTTTTLPSVATDHRDIVLVSSPDGVGNWSSKVRVNDDSTPSDQAFPAIAADHCGVHVLWYDRRFGAPCHALADVVMASSYDGGASFLPNVRVTTQSSWWQVPAEAIPNFGDFMRPANDDHVLYAPWTDGRFGDPDVMMSPIDLGFSLSAPDSITAIEEDTLQLQLRVENGPFNADVVQVGIQSDCGELLPVRSYMLDPFTAGADTMLVYDPFVPIEIHSVAPCTLTVTATSLNSGRTCTVRVRVRNDGTVPVELYDFNASWSAGAVHLSWRSDAGARFDVRRAADPAGPYELLTSRPVGAAARGAFEFVDRGTLAGESYVYRLVALGDRGVPTVFGPYLVRTGAPRAVRLLGARPNPFNPGTQVRFELPRAATVTLRVLDVRGRLVATLLDAALRRPGLHAVGWDGHTNVGRRVASGIYIAELAAEGQRHDTRLVLVR